jgi:hypothetical protein
MQKHAGLVLYLCDTCTCFSNKADPDDEQFYTSIVANHPGAARCKNSYNVVLIITANKRLKLPINVQLGPFIYYVHCTKSCRAQLHHRCCLSGRTLLIAKRTRKGSADHWFKTLFYSKMTVLQSFSSQGTTDLIAALVKPQ